ncbi:SPW repeat protein [Streptomyces sp. NPDC088707]|uniref:SPW repeat protein n=1 Tax=Streptomyces sp. NPDC088707 TaxID=3365871 RepID=UPI00382455D9
MAWATAAIGIWTCVAPWIVAGDVAHTRSIGSNLITGAIATLLAPAPAAAHDKDKDTSRHGPGTRGAMPGNH